MIKNPVALVDELYIKIIISLPPWALSAIKQPGGY
jgi:hypothetical protein